MKKKNANHNISVPSRVLPEKLCLEFISSTFYYSHVTETDLIHIQQRLASKNSGTPQESKWGRHWGF